MPVKEVHGSPSDNLWIQDYFFLGILHWKINKYGGLHSCFALYFDIRHVLRGTLSHFCPDKTNISSPFTLSFLWPFGWPLIFRHGGYKQQKLETNLKNKTLFYPACRTRAWSFSVASLSTGCWRGCWSNALTARAVASFCVLGFDCSIVNVGRLPGSPTEARATLEVASKF